MSAQMGGWGANCRCDCDGYRPNTLGGGIGAGVATKAQESAVQITCVIIKKCSRQRISSLRNKRIIQQKNPVIH
jgi:hypothetical protein